jgi:hypothetical protein
MSLPIFNNQDNLQLLWDVLLDELNININTQQPDKIQNIRTVFQTNIIHFIENTKPNALIELNKQFLSQVLLAVKRLNILTPDNPIKKITITNEEVNEPYKIEDILSERQTIFEKELSKQKKEFESYMSPLKPKDVNFADNNRDDKITAMDALVAEKMAERNLDIERIQTTYKPVENWLEPTVTSEKALSQQRLDEPAIVNQSKLKYLNFDANNNITLLSEPKKKVSWDDDIGSTDLFQKLKKTTTPEAAVDDTKKTYAQQASIPLPKPSDTIVSPVVSNVIPSPIIPQSEIIKQLNELTNKVETIYELISKLYGKMLEPGATATATETTNNIVTNDTI